MSDIIAEREDGNDASFYVEKIKKDMSKESILLMIDEQVLEYADEEVMKENDLDEYEYYSEFGNGEAEDDILNNIISKYIPKDTKNYSELFCCIFDELKEWLDIIY
jgi:hypothetical protein